MYTYSETYSKINFIKSHWFSLCYVIFLSIILALLNNDWIFTPAGALDPWCYVGYAHTFDDRNFWSFKASYYKISRILWIFIQYSVRKFFSALSAAYILQFFCLWLGVFSVYFTIRRLLGSVTALIAAVLLIIYQPFLGCGGADYHTALVGPLYALSFLVLTIAAQKEKQILGWLILFGCLYGMVVHTLILYVNFAPLLLIHFFVVRKVFCKEAISIIKFLSPTLGGFVSATVLLGLLSRAYGYSFLFFSPQLKLTNMFLSGDWVTSPWWKPWSEWVLDAYYLAPLAVMMLFAVGSLLFSRKNNHHPVSMLAHNFYLQYVIIAAVWLFWQLLKKDTLNTGYFAYPLIIPFVMAVAASIQLQLSDSLHNTFLPLILGGVAALSLVLKNQFFSTIPQFISGFLLFFAFLSILFFFKRGPLQMILAMICLAVASIFPIYYQSLPYSPRDEYLAITEAAQWLYNTYGKRGVPKRARNIFIWFDEQAPKNPCCPLADIGYSLANTSFDYIHTPFPMPTIQNLKMEEVKGKLSQQKTRVVVLVTENKAQVEELQNRLAQVGVSLDLVQFHEIHVDSIRIPLYVLKGQK